MGRWSSQLTCVSVSVPNSIGEREHVGGHEWERRERVSGYEWERREHICQIGHIYKMMWKCLDVFCVNVIGSFSRKLVKTVTQGVKIQNVNFFNVVICK